MTKIIHTFAAKAFTKTTRLEDLEVVLVVIGIINIVRLAFILP